MQRPPRGSSLVFFRIDEKGSVVGMKRERRPVTGEEVPKGPPSARALEAWEGF